MNLLLKELIKKKMHYPFTYNFYLTNGLGDNDFSIIGDYSIIKKNLIITESQKNNQGEFDIIYYMGKKWQCL